MCRPPPPGALPAGKSPHAPCRDPSRSVFQARPSELGEVEGLVVPGPVTGCLGRPATPRPGASGGPGGRDGEFTGRRKDRNESYQHTKIQTSIINQEMGKARLHVLFLSAPGEGPDRGSQVLPADGRFLCLVRQRKEEGIPET